MKIETTLGREVRINNRFSCYDAVCKKIISHRPVLASNLNSCLPEFRDYSIHDIAEKYIVSPPVISQVPLLPDETNRPQALMDSIVKMSLSLKCCVYYVFRLISSQYGITFEGSHYEGLCYLDLPKCIQKVRKHHLNI